MILQHPLILVKMTKQVKHWEIMVQKTAKSKQIVENGRHTTRLILSILCEKSA